LTKSIRELEREVQSESPQSSTKTQRWWNTVLSFHFIVTCVLFP
jgi:hypothetical protein